MEPRLPLLPRHASFESLLALSCNCAKLEVIPVKTSGEVFKGFVAPINVLSRDGVRSGSLRTAAVSSALLGRHVPDTRFIQMCIHLAALEYDAASYAAGSSRAAVTAVRVVGWVLPRLCADESERKRSGSSASELQVSSVARRQGLPSISSPSVRQASRCTSARVKAAFAQQ